VDNFNLARRVGFSNISVDVMFGVPRQSFSVWEDTLEDVVKLSPEHVSAYSLSIEEGTKFGDMYKEGKISYVDDEEDRRMYHYAIDFLYKHGYQQYEISNFAKSGYSSRHNQVYWRNESYVGVGLGAHSYFGGVRYNNVYDMSEYISRIDNNLSVSCNMEVISRKRDISDYMILGLRLAKGVDVMEFRKRYNQDVMLLFGDRIRKLCKEGLVVCEGDTIMLTSKGKDLANRVFVEFV
jgi:oxygen-independent coproporphyrinogen-3 oxidase